MTQCFTHLAAHFDATGSGSPTDNNTYRYNISQNDAKASWQASGFSAWLADGAQLTNTKVYNNVFYSNKSGKKVINRESAMGSGNRFYNNIILTNGGAQLVGGAASNFLFQNNLYWAFDGNFKYNGTTITSLTAFRGTSGGQERLSGADVGIQVNPKLNSAGAGGTINNPANMAALLTASLQQPASPAKNAALDLLATFGINPGTKDFYGNSLPQGARGTCRPWNLAPRSTSSCAFRRPTEPAT